MHITITHTHDATWTVYVDGKYANHLTIDEAMGCVASAMFLGNDHVLFVKTEEQHRNGGEWVRDEPTVGAWVHVEPTDPDSQP